MKDRYPLTEGLRAGLDAAGIGWEQPRVLGHGITCYRAGGVKWTVIECEVLGEDGAMHPTLRAKTEPLRTAEQALAATVGERTCHTVPMDCFGNPPYNQSGLAGNSTACGCSECGAPWSTMGVFRGNRLKHNFKACPICGAKVVSDSDEG